MTALAVDALAAVRAAGGDVKLVSPKRLKVIAPAPLPDYLVDRLRTAKPELLALLSSITPPTTEIWGEAEEERAAIAEYDGGAPRSWAVAFARLDPARPPADVQSKRWVQFIDDCGRFLDEGWADRASALGWGPLDLFGCDRVKPFARIDRAGLLWMLNGQTLLALAANAAAIAMASGSSLTFRKCPNEPGRVLAWDLSTGTAQISPLPTRNSHNG
jgi:hypothetical protein